MQVLDPWQNKTYVNGQAGSIYKQGIPLANPARKPGEWQTYEVIWMAPVFNEDGSVKTPANVTVLFNGVLVQHKTHFTESISRWNPLRYKTTPYTDKILSSILKTGCGPLFLQDHGSPVRFRNIWIRPLDDKASVFKAE